MDGTLGAKHKIAMKKICLLIFTLLLTAGTTLGQSFWDDMASGSWKGGGTLMGSEADFYMKWSWELDGKFLKLEFQNKRTSDSGRELIFKSHAYYQPKNDSLFKGTWFDSRGVTFPVSGVLKDSTFTVNWGTPETEQGKTVYTLISDIEVKVTDYVLRGENYVKFGEAVYQHSNTSSVE